MKSDALPDPLHALMLEEVRVYACDSDLKTCRVNWPNHPASWCEACLIGGLSDALASVLAASPPQNLEKRIERGMALGRILGPEYDGATFKEVARELVQVKAQLAAASLPPQEQETEPLNAQGPTISHWEDTPLLKAKRKAFDYPSQANLDSLIAAAKAEVSASLPPEAK